MHAVFMGMPTASSKGGVPLTGMQPLTTMARQTLEPGGCMHWSSFPQSGSLPDSSNAWHAVTCAPISICSMCQEVPEVQQLSKDSWNSYTYNIRSEVKDFFYYFKNRRLLIV